MNAIKAQIKKYLTGEESLSIDAYLAIQEHTKKVIVTGVENDADAMLYALRIGDKIYVVLLAGRSMIQDFELTNYLKAYFADAKGFEYHLPKIVDYLYEDIAGQTDAYMMLRDDSNDRWRAFRPLLNIDEIYAKQP